MELRRVTAELLLRFDISLAPGKVNDAFFEGWERHIYFYCCTVTLEIHQEAVNYNPCARWGEVPKSHIMLLATITNNVTFLQQDPMTIWP